MDGIDGVGAGRGYHAAHGVADDAAVGGDHDGAVAVGAGKAVAHLDAVGVDEGGLVGVEVNHRVAGEGVGVPCQLGVCGVEVGRDGAVADHLDVDGEVSGVDIAPSRQVEAGGGGGDDGHGAVGHDGVGAVIVGGHECLSVGGNHGAHGAVGDKGQCVGVVEEVDHDVGVAGHGDVADVLGGGDVIPAVEVVLLGRLGDDGDLRAGLDDIHALSHDGDAVGHGRDTGHGEASAGGNHGGGAGELAVDADVVLGGGVVGHHAGGIVNLINLSGLVPCVGVLSVEDVVGHEDGLVAVDGVAGIALEVDAAFAVRGECHDRVAAEVGGDHEVAVGHGDSGDEVVGRGGVTIP